MFATKRKDVNVRMTQRLWQAVMSSLASQKPVPIALKFGLSSMINDATNQNLLQPQFPFPRCIVICCCKITLCCHVNRKRNNNKCNNDKWIKHRNENMTALFQYCSQAKSGVKTLFEATSVRQIYTCQMSSRSWAHAKCKKQRELLARTFHLNILSASETHSSRCVN